MQTLLPHHRTESPRMPTFSFDPSSATFLKALALHEHVSIISTTIGRIEQLLEDPQNLQPKMLKTRPDLAQEIDLNTLIQRTFEGKKKSNVKAYASYLRELILSERNGGTPPLHLWTETHLELTPPPEQQYLLATPDATFLAIDGQTQLAADFELLRTATPEFKRIIRNWPVAAVVYHGIDVYYARQLFYDLNVLGVTVNTAQGLGMNTVDPLMKIVRHLEDTIPPLTGRVEKAARQISKDSHNLMTIQTLRQMVVNIARGISGVQYGAKPVPTEDLDIEFLTHVCEEFITALMTQFAYEITDRANSVLPAASTLAAISAMVHDIYANKIEKSERANHLQKIFSGLQKIDWRKSQQWSGTAGKWTPKGLAIGGPKEVGYNIYRALTDPSSEAYGVIRKSEPTI